MSRAFGSASARSSGKASLSNSATSRTMSSTRGISIALPLRPRPDRASTRMAHFRRTLSLKQRIAATIGCRREYPYEPVHTVAADQPVQTWPTVDAVASGALRKYHLARPSKRTASVNARDFAQRCLPEFLRWPAQIFAFLRPGRKMISLVSPLQRSPRGLVFLFQPPHPQRAAMGSLRYCPKTGTNSSSTGMGALISDCSAM